MTLLSTPMMSPFYPPTYIAKVWTKCGSNTTVAPKAVRSGGQCDAQSWITPAFFLFLKYCSLNTEPLHGRATMYLEPHTCLKTSMAGPFCTCIFSHWSFSVLQAMRYLASQRALQGNGDCIRDTSFPMCFLPSEWYFWTVQAIYLPILSRSRAGTASYLHTPGKTVSYALQNS